MPVTDLIDLALTQRIVVGRTFAATDGCAEASWVSFTRKVGDEYVNPAT